MNKISRRDNLQKDALQLGALAHPVRLEIVRHLAARDACCVKDLVARSDLAQSTISQHLKKLVDAELVQYKPVQQQSHYVLNRDEFSGLSKRLTHIFDLCCTCGSNAAATKNKRLSPSENDH